MAGLVDRIGYFYDTLVDKHANNLACFSYINQNYN